MESPRQVEWLGPARRGGDELVDHRGQHPRVESGRVHVEHPFRRVQLDPGARFVDRGCARSVRSRSTRRSRGRTGARPSGGVPVGPDPDDRSDRGVEEVEDVGPEIEERAPLQPPGRGEHPAEERGPRNQPRPPRRGHPSARRSRARTSGRYRQVSSTWVGTPVRPTSAASASACRRSRATGFSNRSALPARAPRRRGWPARRAGRRRTPRPPGEEPAKESCAVAPSGTATSSAAAAAGPTRRQARCPGARRTSGRAPAWAQGPAPTTPTRRGAVPAGVAHRSARRQDGHEVPGPSGGVLVGRAVLAGDAGGEGGPGRRGDGDLDPFGVDVELHRRHGARRHQGVGEVARERDHAAGVEEVAGGVLAERARGPPSCRPRAWPPMPPRRRCSGWAGPRRPAGRGSGARWPPARPGSASPGPTRRRGRCRRCRSRGWRSRPAAGRSTCPLSSTPPAPAVDSNPPLKAASSVRRLVRPDGRPTVGRHDGRAARRVAAPDVQADGGLAGPEAEDRDRCARWAPVTVSRSTAMAPPTWDTTAQPGCSVVVVGGTSWSWTVVRRSRWPAAVRSGAAVPRRAAGQDQPGRCRQGGPTRGATARLGGRVGGADGRHGAEHTGRPVRRPPPWPYPRTWAHRGRGLGLTVSPFRRAGARWSARRRPAGPGR